MTAARVVVALGLLMQAASVSADTAWVSDRLQAGLHEERDGASTVLVLLPTGTEVEVLEVDDGVAFVRTTSGTEGWVDAQYLSETRPAALLLADAESARAQADEALAAASNRIAELEAQLSAVQEAAEQATADAGAAGPQVQSSSFAAPVNSETLRELQRVAEENQRLRQQLAESDAAAEMALERLQQVAAEPVVEPALPVVAVTYDHYLLALRDWTPWQWLIVASTLLLFFSLGLWSADTGVRRRHGGFRLRV